MNEPTTTVSTGIADRIKATTQNGSRARWWGYALVGVVLIGGGVFVAARWAGKTKQDDSQTLYTVIRQDLIISIKESGRIKAMEKLEIKSEVPGNVSIISLVSEGTRILPEDTPDYELKDSDIKVGMILVELDSAGLRDRLIREQESLESAKINHTDAEVFRDTQINQNKSNINKALLNVKYARMDLQKYLGNDLAGELMKKYEKQIAAAETDFITNLDLSEYAESEKLKGEGCQRRKKLENDIRFAKQEQARAEEDLANTQELFDQDFATGMALKESQLEKDRRDVNLEQTRTARQLFLDFDFKKMATQRFNDYIEMIQELGRTESKTTSELSKAQARLKGKHRQLVLSREKVEQTEEHIEKCCIRATKQGMVIYATHGRYRTPIERGDSVRERQTILIIPDPSKMALEVDIHESVIRKVELGQQAIVSVDSLPGTVFTGKVERISNAADASGSWRRGTTATVYKSTISINETDHRIKTNGKGQVEIFIGTLKDILAVPIQAVHSRGTRQFVFMAHSKRDLDYGVREVTVGDSNNEFVQIVKGLFENDVIHVDPPGDLNQRLKPFADEAEKKNNGFPADFKIPVLDPPVKAVGENSGDRRPRGKRSERSGKPRRRNLSPEEIEKFKASRKQSRPKTHIPAP